MLKVKDDLLRKKTLPLVRIQVFFASLGKKKRISRKLLLWCLASRRTKDPCCTMRKRQLLCPLTRT